MAKKTYDPLKVTVTINGVPLNGWADGDMVMVEYDADQTTKHIGTGGEGRFVKSNDVSGVCTFRLADYSDSNAVLTLIRNVDIEVPITITDKTSNADLFFTTGAKLQKTPAFGKGNEAKMNEWPFIFLKGTIDHTGAADL